MPEVNPDSSNRDLSQLEADKADCHPLKYRYDADTIFRYPKEDISETVPYPLYTPMFCFPSDLSFISHENGKPPDTFHSFVITESTGAKTYGVCLRTHVLPGVEHASIIETMINEWRGRNLGASDYEFAQHVQTQLAYEKEKLLKIKLGITRESLESRHEAEDTINVLEELITPLRQSVLIQAENIYIPTCLGVLSKYPFYDMLKDWLCLVVHGAQTADFDRFPFERCVINLVHEIPLPPPGKLEVAIPFETYKLYISRPPINHCQYSCYPLFRTMGLENIVTLFELLITEYKVILLSEHASILTIICETLCGWLYPFYWHHILIPILPARLLGYLQAPVPYLVGIQKNAFPKWQEEGWKPADAAVVDVDNDIIDFPALKVKIPLRERKKLIQHLEKYSGQTMHSIRRGVPETLKYAFPLNKLIISPSSSSTIDYRTIRDIPRSMYTTYSNAFLAEKCGSLSTHHKAVIPPSDAAVSPEGGRRNSVARKDSVSRLDPVTIQRESVLSHLSSRSSYVESNSNESESAVKANDVNEGILAAHLPTAPLPIPLQVEPSLIPSPSSSPSSTTSKATGKASWWKFSPSTAHGKPEKQSLFDKYLHPQHDSSPFAVIGSPNSGEISPDRLNPTSAGTTPLQSPPVMYQKEGHLFHQLVLAEKTITEPHISLEIPAHESEEFVVRFTPESGSSDEMSRSDMSTATADNRLNALSSRHKRSAGQSRSNAAGKKDRGLSPIRNATLKVKKTSVFVECSMCLHGMDSVKEKILMCEHCHIQLHDKCLTLTEGSPCQVNFNEDKISLGFFKIFTSLMRYYRSYMKVTAGMQVQENSEETSMAQWFKKQEFINEFDSESKPFVTILLETQAFAQFILDRVERPEDDYEILFFDESIKQKKNRSRMRFTKESTPFLSETSYKISKTVEALRFDDSDIPLDNFNSLDPLEWNPAFEKQPRQIQNLATESDQQMMRCHTNELVSRARLNAKTKYDFSKWMKLRWKLSDGKLAEDALGNNFVSDDQRREALEDQVKQVNVVIDQYEAAHISSQTHAQLENAVSVLTAQNQKILLASEEEQVVDNYLFQHTLARLMRVLSIYQTAMALGPKPEETPNTLPLVLPPHKELSSIQLESQRNTGIADWVSTIPVSQPGEDKRAPSIKRLNSNESGYSKYGWRQSSPGMKKAESDENDYFKASIEGSKRDTVSQRDYFVASELGIEAISRTESQDIFNSEAETPKRNNSNTEMNFQEITEVLEEVMKSIYDGSEKKRFESPPPESKLTRMESPPPIQEENKGKGRREL